MRFAKERDVVLNSIGRIFERDVIDSFAFQIGTYIICLSDIIKKINI